MDFKPIKISLKKKEVTSRDLIFVCFFFFFNLVNFCTLHYLGVITFFQESQYPCSNLESQQQAKGVPWRCLITTIDIIKCAASEARVILFTERHLSPWHLIRQPPLISH
jgi:hypothetical protein